MKFVLKKFSSISHWELYFTRVNIWFNFCLKIQTRRNCDFGQRLNQFEPLFFRSFDRENLRYFWNCSLKTLFRKNPCYLVFINADHLERWFWTGPKKKESYCLEKKGKMIVFWQDFFENWQDLRNHRIKKKKWNLQILISPRVMRIFFIRILHHNDPFEFPHQLGRKILFEL